MTHPLDGCRAKIERAREHLNTLDTKSSAFIRSLAEEEDYRIVEKPDPQGGGKSFRLKVFRQPPALRWGVMAGDVTHNLRCALDHLIEQLTIANRKTVLDGTEFPIFSSPIAYANVSKKGLPTRTSGLYRVRGLSQPAQAVIKTLQPYNRGNDVPNHPLWLLGKLWNIDKHRIVPVLALANRGIGLIPQPGLMMQGPSRLEGSFPFKNDAEVAWQGRGAYMNVQLQLNIQVAFEDGGPGLGKAVVPALFECLQCVAGVVAYFRPWF